MSRLEKVVLFVVLVCSVLMISDIIGWIYYPWFYFWQDVWIWIIRHWDPWYMMPYATGL